MPSEEPGILSALGTRRLAIFPLGIALLGLVINIAVATSMSLTFDEPDYVSYGLAILHGKPDRFKDSLDSKMPVSVLNALPVATADYLRNHRRFPRLERILRGMHATRYGTIAAAFCLCLLVFIYVDSLFGRTAALFAETLFVIEPNIIAHSALATNDLYVAFGMLLALYFLRRYLLSPVTRNAVLAAVTLALAQLMKFTALCLFGVYAVVLTFAVVTTKYGRKPRCRISARQALTLGALSVAAFLVAINVGFVFDRTFTPLEKYAFQSETFQSLQRVPVLRAIPLPLPYPYLQGFDRLSSNNKSHVTFGNIVLLNEVRGPELQRSDGFPSYFLIAWLVKEPIGMQILLLLGLMWIFRSRSANNDSSKLAGEGLLLATAAVVFAAFSFFSQAQVGIRHVLPALVILTVLSGGAFQGWQTFSRQRRILLAGCVIYAGISVGSYFPFMLSYFNEIVFDRKMAYRVLADSNLEWGQDDGAVMRYLKRHPGVVLDPPNRVPGLVLISANLAAGVFPGKADYFVRREGLRPVGEVGYGHLLFDVPLVTLHADVQSVTGQN
jgi:4-amino-4-deoxy-L-arabinose transferase-like glycosyltransferase